MRIGSLTITRFESTAALTAVVLCLVVSGVGPTGALIGACAVGVLIVSMTRPDIAFALCLFAAFTSWPASVSRSVSVVGFPVQYYEILLVLVALSILLRQRTVQGIGWVIPLALVLVVGVAIGLYSNTIDLASIVYDVRRITTVVVAAFVASQVGLVNLRLYAVVVAAILWVSSVFVVIASVTHLDIGQRELIASLEGGDGDAASRILTETTYLAGVVFAGILYMFVTGSLNAKFRVVSIWLVPSLLLVILSFSRNILIGLTVAVLAALCASFSVAAARRVSAAVAAVVVVIPFVGWALWNLPSGPLRSVFGWGRLQWDGFSNRVIDGVRPSSIRSDGSIQYRTDQENPFLYSAIDSSPILGHGFGYAYKPFYTGRQYRYMSDTAELLGTQYAHNFYLWLAVKVGVLGVAICAATILLAMARVLRAARRQDPRLPAGVAGTVIACLTGVLAQSVVAPLPNGMPSAVLVGCLIGLLFALATCVSNLDSRLRVPTITRARTGVRSG